MRLYPLELYMLYYGNLGCSCINQETVFCAVHISSALSMLALL